MSANASTPVGAWPPHRIAWRVAQVAVWVVGVGILSALVLAPEIGLHAFWNVLIPIAPALLAIAPGLWRNICPLASTALVPRHLRWSRGLELPRTWQDRLGLVGVLVLLAVVPLRHVVLDLNGPATALAIVLLGVVAVALGVFFEWKSGWCSGMCPVHPVEKLYGSAPIVTVANAHCNPCARCVSRCPDSMLASHALTSGKSGAARTTAMLMVGGFPGFVWGWFQVPDYAGSAGWDHLASAYGWPLVGLLVTLLAYVLLRSLLSRAHHARLVVGFATAAIACYYWYRLPALFGFGPFPGDGMLVDLTSALPAWFPWASRLATTSFFALWLTRRVGTKPRWAVRLNAPRMLHVRQNGDAPARG